MTFDARAYLGNHLSDSGAVISQMQHSTECKQTILDIAQLLVRTFRAGNKLLICGNGGSCADAQHIAAEFLGSYKIMLKRRPLPAIALTDSAIMTATANDHSYEYVFERQALGLLVEGDMLLGISTSGKSVNVFRALAAANLQFTRVLFTGSDCAACSYVDHILRIPSTSTPIIQQGYMAAAHAIVGIVEQEMFG